MVPWATRTSYLHGLPATTCSTNPLIRLVRTTVLPLTHCRDCLPDIPLASTSRPPPRTATYLPYVRQVDSLCLSYPILLVLLPPLLLLFLRTALLLRASPLVLSHHHLKLYSLFSLLRGQGLPPAGPFRTDDLQATYLNLLHLLPPWQEVVLPAPIRGLASGMSFPRIQSSATLTVCPHLLPVHTPLSTLLPSDISRLGPFPEELLHFLRERQVGAASDPPQEPPRKRAKLQQAAADAIPVGNASLTLTRPADPDSSVSGSEAPVQIQDAHRHLNFYVAPHQEALILESSSKHSKGTGSYLNVELPLALPSSCSHGVQAATRLLGSIRADPAAEGALWATVSIAYSRHDRTDSLALTFQVHWTQAKYAIRDYRLRHFSELVIEAFMPARCLNPKGSPDKFTRPKDFYEVAHVTNSSSKPIPHQYSIEGLEATPYPFQQRALHWLWNREGVDLCHGSEGEETALGPLTKGLSRLPFSFSSHTDLYGQRYYLR